MSDIDIKSFKSIEEDACTVKEAIEILKKFPEDTPVKSCCSDGYCKIYFSKVYDGVVFGYFRYNLRNLYSLSNEIYHES